LFLIGGRADRFLIRRQCGLSWLARSTTRQQLAAKYPFLTRERLARTWNQAMYFSMK
jgi:uncharacterized protein (DUF433 family)